MQTKGTKFDTSVLLQVLTLTKVHCICCQVDQVDREPGGSEDHHHGDQHLVDPPVPGGLLLPLLGGPGARHALRPLAEPHHDLDVADHDGGEGQHELGHVSEGAVDELRDPLPGLLAVESAGEMVWDELHKVGISEKSQRSDNTQWWGILTVR